VPQFTFGAKPIVLIVTFLRVTQKFTVVTAVVPADPCSFVAGTVSDVRPRSRQRHANAQYWIAAAEHQGVPTLRTTPRCTICGMT